MSETQEQKGNINDILKLINRVNETFTYEIYIPSLSRNVMFRQINTSQQKRLIKAIIDSPAYNTQFIFTLRGIIEENCAEKINVNDLTILDKLIIAIKMRAYSVGNDFELTFEIPRIKKPDEKEDENAPKTEKITRILNLNELLDGRLESIKIEPLTIKDANGVYSVDCFMPTIFEEYSLEDELRNTNKSIEIKNESELRETIGEVFINEVVKYIKKISIKDKDNIVEIDLKTVNFKNRVRILEQLPTALTKLVVDYISTVTKEFEKIILIKETINGTVIEQRLKIDASFFTRS